MIGAVTMGLLLAGGIGAAWAADNNPGAGSSWSFEKMLPFMKQMHPNMNDSELKQMYNICNANGGPAKMGQMMKNGTTGNMMQQMMGNGQVNK
jgi:hypothetical protein